MTKKKGKLTHADMIGIALKELRSPKPEQKDLAGEINFATHYSESHDEEKVSQITVDEPVFFKPPQKEEEWITQIRDYSKEQKIHPSLLIQAHQLLDEEYKADLRFAEKARTDPEMVKITEELKNVTQKATQ